MANGQESLKDHLVHISAQLAELKIVLSRIEKHQQITEASGVATQTDILNEVISAIKETQANSVQHSRSVYRVVLSSLEARAFDNLAVQDCIVEKLSSGGK
jgi:hypothetical protein